MKRISLIVAALLFGTAVSRGADALEWHVATSNPPGALYHLIWKGSKDQDLQAIVRYPAHYSVPMHQHSYDETLYVLRGRIKVRTESSEQVLRSGDSIVLPAGQSHAIDVIGWRRADAIISLFQSEDGVFPTLDGLFGG
jgi:quercetin dioxygenase-like cupin family protein